MVFEFSDKDRELTIYHYDDSGIFTQSADVLIEANTGLPAKSTIKRPPTLKSAELAIFDVDGWSVIEDHRGKVIYSQGDCTQTEVITELGKIPEGFTLAEPTTPFDEWISGAWITNKSNKYIAEYNQIDDKRRTLYSQMCDPLKMEAMDLMDEGKEAEALQLKQQALAAKQKIKTENPWPTPPEN